MCNVLSFIFLEMVSSNLMCIRITIIYLHTYIFRWSPKGQLVAHFHEHKAAINK